MISLRLLSRFCFKFAFATASIAFATAASAGPYSVTPISANSPNFSQWASQVVNYSPSPGVSAGNAVSTNATGAANGSTVSLGDLDATQISNNIAVGRITLQFATPFTNGPGWDIAAFENAGNFFTAPFIFGELGYVEVSSNGTDFARFPSISLNTEPTEGTADTKLVTNFGRNFAGLNPTNTYNLVGIHAANLGTPFDLDDLLVDPLVVGGQVNLNQLQFVRIVDIPGNGAFLDSAGNPILDAWVTSGAGGVDLDAIGVRYNAVPEPSTITLAIGAIGIGMAVRRRQMRRAPLAI